MFSWDEWTKALVRYWKEIRSFSINSHSYVLYSQIYILDFGYFHFKYHERTWFSQTNYWGNRKSAVCFHKIIPNLLRPTRLSPTNQTDSSIKQNEYSTSLNLSDANLPKIRIMIPKNHSTRSQLWCAHAVCSTVRCRGSLEAFSGERISCDCVAVIAVFTEHHSDCSHLYHPLRGYLAWRRRSIDILGFRIVSKEAGQDFCLIPVFFRDF